MTAPDAPPVEPLKLTLEEALVRLGERGYMLSVYHHAYAPREYVLRDVYSSFARGSFGHWKDAVEAVLGVPVVPRDDTAETRDEAARALACSNCGDDNGLYIGLTYTRLCRECIAHAAKHLPTLDIPSPAKSLARDAAAAFGIEETPEMVGSLSHFLRHITYEEALDAIAITMSKGIKGHDAFRYFCGICWNWIRPGRNA